jgi:hypothetical protein
VILLVGFYQDRSAVRMGELVECLRRNLRNESIDEVHVFLEDSVDPATHAVLADPKVRLQRHGRRLTFHDLFAHASRALPERRVIIANNDIYFDHTLARLESYDLGGKLLCLSRWDQQPDGSARFFEQPWSQDAWMFQAPLMDFACHWHLGLPGCENRLAHEATAAGLTLENPSRTVRAHHLHLSRVRHYVERQRLAGHGRGVEATFLGTPWLWPIVGSMGRLDDLCATFGALAAQPRSSPVLVDYACPEGSGAWTRAHHPRATVVAVADRRVFSAADARNAGAAAADGDAVLCFLDADVLVAPDFAAAVLDRFEDGSFLIPDASGPGLDSVLICRRAAFDSAGGFDPLYLGWGAKTVDLRVALGTAGLRAKTFPSSLLAHRPPPVVGAAAAGARRSFAPLGDPALTGAINDSYRRIKSAVAAEVGSGISRASLREIQRAIVHRKQVERGLVPDAPCAAIAFREAMGYTVARLQPGASSHNNDRRPFEAIPSLLDGLAFTQVVASRVSPVKVEFRGAGKLYVLVGTDWDGYQPATAFLREHGYRERLPAVRTGRGTGFEVWSLVGEVGDQVELPTQVMLVARELVAA